MQTRSQRAPMSASPRIARPRRVRLAPIVMSFALCGLSACHSGAEDSARPKNLLLFVFDTTRADYLGCYGNQAADTPASDSLAESGSLFEAAYSQSSLTPVSASSFLTGLWPYKTGVRSLFAISEDVLDASAVTLADHLSQRGLATGAFVSAVPMGKKYGLNRGFERYDERRPDLVAGCGNAFQRRGEQTVDAALEWLDTQVDQSFFAMVHLFDCHDLTLAPPREFLKSRVDFKLPPDTETPCVLRGASDAQKIELYAAEVAFMDAQLARILERLDRLGMREDTLVAIVADHGEGLGDHDAWTHGWLWGEQLRVPLILSGPGVPRGRVLERVRLVDLVPTLLELFNAPAPENIDGTSLLALMGADSAASNSNAREVYAEVHHADGDFLGREQEMYSLTRDSWKLIYLPSHGEHRLYDLDADPAERNNLYSADHPVAMELSSILESRRGDYVVDPSRLSDEEREGLERLGYLGEDSEPNVGAAESD